METNLNTITIPDPYAHAIDRSGDEIWCKKAQELARLKQNIKQLEAMAVLVTNQLKELLKELGATAAQIAKAEGIVNESTQVAIDAEVAGLKKKNKELLEKYKNPDDDARQKLIILPRCCVAFLWHSYPTLVKCLVKSNIGNRHTHL